MSDLDRAVTKRPARCPFTSLEREQFMALRAYVGDCIVWTGAVNKRNGGAIFRLKGSWTGAHRVAWELERGAIPTGMEIRQTCRNKLCVNVNHLEMLTRSANRLKTVPSPKACPYGHPYEGDNLWLWKSPKGVTVRRCRTCHNQRAASYYQRHREAILEKRREAKNGY